MNSPLLILIERVLKISKEIKFSLINSQWQIYGDIKTLKSHVAQIPELIIEKYPVHAEILKESIDNFKNKSPRILGYIECILLFIQKEEQQNTSFKIFISHSSKDKVIVEKFADTILRLGIGISPEDIFCTSIEGMNIQTGEDIRSHIKNNLRHCDYVFLMISKNYNKSFVCLNEMGAAWALEKQVRSYLLSNTTLKALSWTLNPTVASVLGEESTLNMLHDELCEKYSLTKRSTIWGKHKNDFLEYCTKL